MAREIIRGQRGGAVLGVLLPDDEVEYVPLHLTQYEVELEGVVREASTPNGEGWAEALPKIRAVRRVTLKWHDGYVDNEALYPVLGYLQPNSELHLYLRRGERQQWYQIVFTVVRRLTPTNPIPHVREWTMTCEYGRFAQLDESASGPVSSSDLEEILFPPAPPPDPGGDPPPEE